MGDDLVKLMLKAIADGHLPVRHLALEPERVRVKVGSLEIEGAQATPGTALIGRNRVRLDGAEVRRIVAFSLSFSYENGGDGRWKAEIKLDPG